MMTTNDQIKDAARANRLAAFEDGYSEGYHDYINGHLYLDWNLQLGDEGVTPEQVYRGRGYRAGWSAAKIA